MTSLIRGFDESLRDIDPAARAEHDLRRQVQRREPRGRRAISPTCCAGRTSPWTTPRRSRSWRRRSDRGHLARRRLAQTRRSACSTAASADEAAGSHRRHRAVRRASTSSSSTLGRFFTEAEVQRQRQRRRARRQRPTRRCSRRSGIDPVGKKVRIGAVEYTVVGVLGKRPSVGVRPGQDDFVVIPQTTHQAVFGTGRRGAFGGVSGAAR